MRRLTSRTVGIAILLCAHGFGRVGGSADAAELQHVRATALEEVIVTAQKREENVQRVPMSIAVLNESALERSGVTSLDAVQRYAPGLTMATVGSGFVSYTYLRGSGTNQIDSGTDPSVAFFVDEVYVTGTAGLQFDLFDVERIEVLKGPQGTLFGRNAAAGAISITTKRPSATFGGTAAFELGNHDNYNGRATLTGPMNGSGSVRYRISGAFKERGPFTENLAGENPGDVSTRGARAQLEFVGEKATLLLSASAFRARNGMTNQFMASESKASILLPADAALLPLGESFYKHYYNVDGFEHQDTQDVTGRLEWRTGLGQVTSISAYRLNKFDRVQDQDGTILAASVLASRQHDRSISQELRLTRDFAAHSLVVGVYGYRNESEREDQIRTGPYFATVAFRNSVGLDHNEITTTSYAGFGQLTFAFTDTFSVVAGARYTHDSKDDERLVKRYTSPAYTARPRGSWSSFDPAVTANYQLAPNALLYASYRRGFKSGGFQTLLPLRQELAELMVAPERVTSFEIGGKSEWFDRRLLANIAVFRADITDQQVLRSVALPGLGINFVIDNAGQTRTDGIDLMLSVLPGAGLRLDGSMTFQKARFQRYDSAGVSFAGKHQLRSPDFTGSFAAEYRVSIPAGGNVTARAEYNYQSTVFFDNANTRLPGVYQPGFGLANARLGYSPARGNWEVALWARNLTDEKYLRNIAVTGVSGLAAPGDPRTFGAALRVNF